MLNWFLWSWFLFVYLLLFSNSLNCILNWNLKVSKLFIVEIYCKYFVNNSQPILKFCSVFAVFSEHFRLTCFHIFSARICISNNQFLKISKILFQFQQRVVPLMCSCERVITPRVENLSIKKTGPFFEQKNRDDFLEKLRVKEKQSWCY